LHDGAILLETAEPHQLAAALSEASPTGLLDTVPGARTLLVLFDPERFDESQLERIRAESRPFEARTVRLLAKYDGADLDALAAEQGFSRDELVRLHVEQEHRVAFLGFAPGFPYMTGGFPVPRLKTPRVRVPERSLAVADGWTGIYPSETPGGWRLLGRVAERMFDPLASPPSLLRPGDRVIFEPVRELPELPPLTMPPQRGEAVLGVIAPGLFTSVQGGPRYGLSAYGVPAGGAMDLAALAAANVAVGNPPGAAGLEITLAGPELEALVDIRLSLRGEARELRRGERLRCGPVQQGVREYLAVEGGLALPLPGEPTRGLRAGAEILRTGAPPPDGRRPPSPAGEEKNNYFFSGEVRARRGPQWDYFADPGQFFAREWTLSPQSDRRGLRLQGEPMRHLRRPDIPPEGTAPGSVQVPGDGLPIALGPDRPVTGGYAKIATVLWDDLPILAQARPGARLRFREAA
jgi:KipI family sensor histidine kinase inhibitor